MTAEITEQQAVSLPTGETDEPSVPADEAAPYGYMTDPDTGERRAKKRPGRRPRAARAPAGKTPSIQELQSLGTLSDDAEDAAPGAPPKGKRKPAMKAESLPPFRAGVIAKGINKTYRKAGRIIRLFDHDIGTAVIASTRRDPDADEDEDDDVTVGEAWENLARTNPRIRLFLMRFIAGGAWSGLFGAHMPIFLAIAMKESIRSRIPLLELATVFLTDEPEDGGQAVPSDLSQMMGGLNPNDMGQMMQMAQQMMGQMAAGVPRPPNGPREPVADHSELAEPRFHGMGHPADQG